MSVRLLEAESVRLTIAGDLSGDGGDGDAPEITHLFEDRERLAINAALAAMRPLLVRGEPGIGKSQLARAAAAALGRRYVSKVVDARTESQDLLFTLDAVRRLADAQLIGHGGELGDGETVAERLSESNYITPGPLWWGFQWEDAYRHAGRAKSRPEGTPTEAPGGVVVLLDEIDKADSSVPNGLLECLGQRQFAGPQGKTVRFGRVPPLVVVTTNEERSLPDAFLRRCLVLHMKLPKADSELLAWLMRRGRAHFGPDVMDDAVLVEAGEMLIEDRKAAKRRQLSQPGGAEYLDLLRALSNLADTGDAQKELLVQLRDFTLRKHPEGP
ncbi:MAG: MoxR family ATPase [Acidobacteriota bacterium]